MPAHRTDPAIEANILRDFEEGHPVTAVAERNNVHRSTVYRCLARYGLVRAPGSQKDKLHAAAMKLCRDGLRFANGAIDKETFLDNLAMFEAAWKDKPMRGLR